MAEAGSLTIGAWLPTEWGRPLTDAERATVAASGIDLLLAPANHDRWANRDTWRQVAADLDTAVYVGLDSDGWALGFFTAPGDGPERVYVKHTAADHVAFDRSDWGPEAYLDPVQYEGADLGLAIHEDAYLAPLMGYPAVRGADVLLPLGEGPVRRHTWGELLQARAIENAAYVVSTMHGTDRDGSETRTRKAHVVGFDPTGAPLTLTDADTGRTQAPFETTPGNIYRVRVDPARATRTRQRFHDRAARAPISRVRENELDGPGVSATTLTAQVGPDQLVLEYGGERVTRPSGESGPLELGGESFRILTVDGPAALEPERLHERLLDRPPDDRTLLVHNRWETLDAQYLEAVVEPVLRARCVEWCSPVLVSSPDRARAYQLANAARATHEVPAMDGVFRLEMARAYGLDAALEPVKGEWRKLGEVAGACAHERSAADPVIERR